MDLRPRLELRLGVFDADLSEELRDEAHLHRLVGRGAQRVVLTAEVRCTFVAARPVLEQRRLLEERSVVGERVVVEPVVDRARPGLCDVRRVTGGDGCAELLVEPGVGLCREFDTNLRVLLLEGVERLPKVVLGPGVLRRHRSQVVDRRRPLRAALAARVGRIAPLGHIALPVRATFVALSRAAGQRAERTGRRGHPDSLQKIPSRLSVRVICRLVHWCGHLVQLHWSIPYSSYCLGN